MEAALKRMMTGSGEIEVEVVKDERKGKGKGKRKQMVAKGKGNTIESAHRRTSERVPNVGPHTIEIYYPQFYLRADELEEYDALPERYGPSVIGKYTKGIGAVEYRYPTDDEDPVSFAMTVLHRLVDRMEAKGINETGNYTMNGETLPLWKAFGRVDVGSESLIDRSKSIKTYCMDLFERYGEGMSNIEGVDMYNACYGGQAAHLAVLGWVESDRWDGRYGLAIATDISDVPHEVMFSVGAACTGMLLYPDAPLVHHSVRASCIRHRFDFCKPVGWHHMGPVTDGKYSIETYMDAIDACYETLREKMNGRQLIPLTDYNAFHTGGGFHVVKKAFERVLRADQPGLKADEKARLVQKRLMPSVKILKIIGPCHTVSSFLNTASVCMSEWDQALGKILVVFTYGSGCAASMYQMRFDDVPFFDPFPVWRMKFYEKAIKMPASSRIHQVYVDTWMKFSYHPHGRVDSGIDLHLLEDDAYYLMYIDDFGRRFYHRGGMKGPPLPAKLRVQADKDEARRMRENFLSLPAKMKVADEDDKGVAGKSQADVWNEIEYALTCGYEETDGPGEIDLGVYRDRYNPEYLTQIVQTNSKIAPTFAPDGLAHTYQIVGTWSRRMPEEMVKRANGVWEFEVTLGENRWEEFHIMEDNDPKKHIHPALVKSQKGVPCIGPHDGGFDSSWIMDCRDRVNVEPNDQGMPGARYRITFTWHNMKELTWEKILGFEGEWERGQYYIIGSWNSFEPILLQEDEDRGEGWYTLPEVQMSSLGIEFLFVRNKDMGQKIYPKPDSSGAISYPSNFYEPICGPDSSVGGHWVVDDNNMRSVYSISLYRDPDDVEESGLRLEWEHVTDHDPKEPAAEYFIVGDFNAYGAEGYTKMAPSPNQPDVFLGEVKIRFDKTEDESKTNVESFQILMHKRRDRCIHPSKVECTQVMPHDVAMDRTGIGDKCWCIGKHPTDQANKGDAFTVRLLVQRDGKMDVSWSKSFE